jgi:hypothetical protein
MYRDIQMPGWLHNLVSILILNLTLANSVPCEVAHRQSDGGKIGPGVHVLFQVGLRWNWMLLSSVIAQTETRQQHKTRRWQ